VKPSVAHDGCEQKRCTNGFRRHTARESHSALCQVGLAVVAVIDVQDPQIARSGDVFAIPSDLAEDETVKDSAWRTAMICAGR
jgi:hypothetical protein